MLFDSFKKNIFLFFSKKYINCYFIFTYYLFSTAYYFYKIDSENSGFLFFSSYHLT